MISYTNSTSAPNRAGGFTLIELVISIAILSIMLTIGYTALSGISRSKVLLDDERDLRFLADSILGRMSRELQLAVAGSPLLKPPDQTNQASTNRASLVGDAGRIDNADADSISFVALEGGQYLPDGQSHSGLVQISYRLATDPESSGQGQERYLLMRNEVPYIRPIDKAFARSMIFPVAKDVLNLRFRYLAADKNEWLAEWGQDASQVILPRVIEFSVTVRSPRGHIKEFKTSVPLRATE